jgi:hypothetical protein
VSGVQVFLNSELVPSQVSRIIETLRDSLTLRKKEPIEEVS